MRGLLTAAAAAVLALSVPAIAGSGTETVLLSENQVLNVEAEFNTPVTIQFPYPVSYVVPTDSRIDVQAGNDFVIVKVLDSSLKSGVLSVVLNKNGKPLVIPVQITLVKKGAPLKVVVRDRDAVVKKAEETAVKAVQTAVRAAKSTPVTDLIAAMIRNTEHPDLYRPVPGYTIVDCHGRLLKSFSSNNLLEARLLYEYRSPVRTGVVIKLINKSIYPLTISEEDFAADGVLAVSLSRRRLAPRPYTATEKLSGDYTAYLYLVIRGDRWAK
jgi:hypothetical protein